MTAIPNNIHKHYYAIVEIISICCVLLGGVQIFQLLASSVVVSLGCASHSTDEWDSLATLDNIDPHQEQFQMISQEELWLESDPRIKVEANNANKDISDSESSACTLRERLDQPKLCHMLSRAQYDLSNLVSEMKEWAYAYGLLVDVVRRSNPNEIFDTSKATTTTTTTRATRNHSSVRTGGNRRYLSEANNRHENEDDSNFMTHQLPVVLAHGMGDSCFNNGMQSVVQFVHALLDFAYVVCIPIGSTYEEDTKNGYLLNWDSAVDTFADSIKKDPKLQNGFHAMGFSQGNNIIRGYIAKYNTPSVHTFISVNGVNAGIGAVPYCIPDTFLEYGSKKKMKSVHNYMCDFLMEQASRSAYTEFAQKHSMQANYWRDPRPSAKAAYQQYCQLAIFNNEAGYINETFKENWSKTQQFVWIMAEDDGMVWPKEGEQWGSPNPNGSPDPFAAPVLPMNQSEWYIDDLFGLQTADKAGKNKFESFPGDHLQFTEDDLRRWINTYLKQTNTALS